MLPTYADVEAAARRLHGHAHRTPVMTSRTADETSGASLFFKCENFQRMGAFKFRGAFNALSLLEPAARARGVIAFSSGNHAQAVALAARILGVHATIVMPQDAPLSKMQATRGYGGDVVTYDRYREDREDIAQRLAAERGAAIIPPFDHPDVIAGQGTAAAELFEQAGPLDSLFVCLGGGGLLAGSILSASGVVAPLQGVRGGAGGGQRRPAIAERGQNRSHRGAENDRRRSADPGFGAPYHLRSFAATLPVFSPSATPSSSTACASSRIG